mgnify:CR=1 FL=1
MTLFGTHDQILAMKFRISTLAALTISCLGFAQWVQAYPDFIGYGYKSCMTCHYNGAGGGALNDYGRALFHAEISSRAFFPKSITDERLGELSGFIPGKDLGRFRPGLKLRELYLVKPDNPNRSITMQADASMAVHLDADQENVLMLSFGYVPRPFGKKSDPDYDEIKTWISREHYVRLKMSENWWAFGGMMDKAFGIRQVDHTLFSRGGLGIGQNDQTHGVLLQRVAETNELFVHLFAGNLFQKSELRHKGLSLMYEFDPSESARLGVSGMMSQNEYMEWLRMALHGRYSLGKGGAISAEGGVRNDKSKATSVKTDTMYGYLQSQLPLTRGYFFLSNLQFVFQNSLSNFPNDTVLSLGSLMFPAPRTEFRLMAILNRPWKAEGVGEDAWQYQAQFHLSW